MTDFWTIYKALLKTLTDTYALKIPALKEYAEICNTIDEVCQNAIKLNWQKDLTPFKNNIRNKDSAFLTDNPPSSVSLLFIPQLWLQSLFSENSKNYIWGYLQSLTDSSSEASSSSANNENSIQDIVPFLNNGKNSSSTSLDEEMPQSVKKLFDSIPNSVMTKVKQVAEKYSENDQKLDNIRYDQLGQELFNSMNKTEMEDMIKNIGGALQSLDFLSALQN